MTDEELIALAEEFSKRFPQEWATTEDIVALARAVERRTVERCAKVCEEKEGQHWGSDATFGAADCAAAIRSLLPKETP